MSDAFTLAAECQYMYQDSLTNVAVILMKGM